MASTIPDPQATPDPPAESGRRAAFETRGAPGPQAELSQRADPDQQAEPGPQVAFDAQVAHGPRAEPGERAAPDQKAEPGWPAAPDQGAEPGPRAASDAQVVPGPRAEGGQRAAPDLRVAPGPQAEPGQRAAPDQQAELGPWAAPDSQVAPDPRAARGPQVAPGQKAEPGPQAAPGQRVAPAPPAAPGPQVVPGSQAEPGQRAAPNHQAVSYPQAAPNPQTEPTPHATPAPHPAAHAPRPPAEFPSEPATATRIETHGIDLIADDERRGHPRQLFAIWAAANVNYLSLVTGGALILMGLTLWQALTVIVTGNLFWLATGLLAVSGPAAGAPSEVITRAMYGVRGNRVNNAIVGWLISVCYFALNLAAASTAAFSLVERIGITPNTGVQIAVVVVIAALTLAIGVYGHALITKLYLPITLALTAVFTVVAVPVLGHTDFGHTPAEPLSGVGLWSVLIAGVTLIGSGPLSYTTSADFARYLPRTTSAKAVAGWTALGGFLAGTAVSSLGACAATAVDMTDPQAGLEKLLPAWFTPVFLLALVLGTIAINALTSYSAGLALQAVGIRIRRTRSVIVDGVAAVSLTLYGLLISNFLDTVSNVLQLTVVLLGPAMAVYATDILLRRNRYDGPALMDETPGSPFWYTAGVNPAGALALTAGVTAAALCVNTLYTGPVAQALGGMDLALPVGLVVASLLYAALMRLSGRTRARTAPAKPPGAAAAPTHL